MAFHCVVFESSLLYPVYETKLVSILNGRWPLRFSKNFGGLVYGTISI